MTDRRGPLEGVRGLCALLLLLAAVWACTLRAGFLWDDHALVLGNAALKEPTFERIFQSDLWCCTAGPTSPYYRPLTALSLLLDRTLFGEAAWGYHLHNVALHLLAVALTWALARPTLGDRRALFAACVFGVHPIQSEAVTWIAARNDLLATVAILGALWAVDRERPSAPLAFGCALIACFTKESSALLPGLAWLWLRRSGRTLDRAGWLALTVPVALAGLAHLQIHWTGTLGTSETRPASLADVVNAVVTFAGWLTIPWPLTSTVTSFATPPWTAWLGAALALLAASRLARTGQAWSLVWAALAFAPAVAGIATFGLFGERYLYLPLFAIAVGVAAVVPSGPVARAVGAVALLVSVSVVSFRSADWTDDASFFASAAERRPDSYTLSLHGNALEKAGDPRGALLAYEAALAEPRRSLFACTRVVGIVFGHVDGVALEDAVARWSAAGCSEVPGFDDDAAMALLHAHRPEAALRQARSTVTPDGSGRVALVEGTVLLADGDLLGAAALGAGWHGGLAGWHEQLFLLADGVNPR